MYLQYFLYSLSIVFGSWLVGMFLNSLLSKTSFYKRLTDLHFVRSKKLNRVIGLRPFRWIVKNTFFKNFNQNLKLSGKAEPGELEALKKEMTSAEISHLIAFVLVSAFALVKSVSVHFSYGLIMMLVNTLLNFYPALLQQENKRRINRFLKVLHRVPAGS
jgi:hypothetical protein